MNRTRDAALSERFYLYRGAAIRSLRQYLDQESHHVTDAALAGIVSLLLADVSRFPTCDASVIRINPTSLSDRSSKGPRQTGDPMLKEPSH